MLQGLMQDDFPLTLHHIRRRMRSCNLGARGRDAAATTARCGAPAIREVAERVDRLARALGRLGVGAGRPRRRRSRGTTSATSSCTSRSRAWARCCTRSTSACSRSSSPTSSTTPRTSDLRRRLARAGAREARAELSEASRHYVVMGDGDAGLRCRTRCATRSCSRRPGRERFDYPELDERQAAALCYTSGTTGNPKGVLYSHRSISLHSSATLMSDAQRPVARGPRAGGRADVPRQRLGAALRRGARGRRSDPARPLPRAPSRWRS